jgi:RNA polymerase primary sigma factor
MSSNLAMIERRPPHARSGHQVCAPVTARAAAKNEINRQSRPGGAPARDGELGLAETSTARHVVEMRASRMLEARIRFVSHPNFDDSTATAEILGSMPGSAVVGNGPGEVHVREVIPFTDADYQGAKFLTRQQEVHLFRKMNFLKYQAAQRRMAINPSRVRTADLDRIDELLREAGAIRNRIIRSYLGLVVSIVKRVAKPSQDFFDLVAEGNVSLIHASERFDWARGARFSTYATLAIINNFARRIPRNRRRNLRFATGREMLLKSVADHRESGRADTMDQEPPRQMIQKMLGCLNDREQTIITRRFGLVDDKQTLVQIGRELGISKERVRQLECRAMNKLRVLADEQKLDLMDASARWGADGHDG